MSSRYAENTKVPVEKSKAEIERLLTRYGVTAFGQAWQEGKAGIQFALQDRHIRIELALPDRAEYRLTPTGVHRSPQALEAAWEQGCRQRWRALALIIKAKLEAIDSGITTLEDEFLPHVVLPDNTTFGQWARPQIEQVYQSGTMPSMLALGDGG